MQLDKLGHPVVRRTQAEKWALLALLLLLNVLLLSTVSSMRVMPVPSGGLLGYRISFAPLHYFTWCWLTLLVALQVALNRALLLGMLSGEGMSRIFPATEGESWTARGVSAHQIVEMVQQMVSQLSLPEIKTIVASRTPVPNAMTGHILGRGNVVILHSNLFDILPLEGIRALLAHELGHVRYQDSLKQQFLGAPRLFVWAMLVLAGSRLVAGVLLASSIWQLLQRVLLTLLVVAALLASILLIYRVQTAISRRQEFLADTFAAAVCGALPTINTLLLVAERTEALTMLSNSVRRLPGGLDDDTTEQILLEILKRFPPGELSEEVAREKAAELYVAARLEWIRKNLHAPLTDQELKWLAGKAAEKLRQQQTDGDAPTTNGPSPLADWRDFDANANGQLDPEEFQRLVQRLEAEPQTVLFRQFLGATSQWSTHPTHRERLLYLARVFPEAFTHAG